MVPRRNSRATLPGLLPLAITPAVGRPARCTVTVPGDTGSVGDVAPHRRQARLRSPPECAPTDGHQRETPVEHSPLSSRTRANHTVARLPQPIRSRQAPVTSRCTRYVPLHPIRRGAPDQKGCNAYGSGAPPPTTSATAGNSSPQTPTVRIGRRHTASTCSPRLRTRGAAPVSERYITSELV